MADDENPIAAFLRSVQRATGGAPVEPTSDVSDLRSPGGAGPGDTPLTMAVPKFALIAPSVTQMHRAPVMVQWNPAEGLYTPVAEFTEAQTPLARRIVALLNNEATKVAEKLAEEFRSEIPERLGDMP